MQFEETSSFFSKEIKELKKDLNLMVFKTEKSINVKYAKKIEEM